MTVRTGQPDPITFAVVQVASSLWAVYDTRIHTDAAIGYIDEFAGRFHVWLQGDEYRVLSFPAHEGAVQWFSVHCASATESRPSPALSLGFSLRDPVGQERSPA
jgi:hypothetical protein